MEPSKKIDDLKCLYFVHLIAADPCIDTRRSHIVGMLERDSASSFSTIPLYGVCAIFSSFFENNLKTTRYTVHFQGKIH